MEWMGGSGTITKVKNTLTPEQLALQKVANLHGFFKSNYVNGGWIYNFNTEKYISYNGEWADEIEDDDIRIPTRDLEEAVKLIKEVCPTDHIIIVTP